MTCTVTHNTGMPANHAATIYGTPPRKPMRWSVTMTVVDIHKTRLQLAARTTAPIAWVDLQQVVGLLVDEAMADLRDSNPQLNVRHIEWIACTRGGQKKGKGRKAR